MNAAPAFTDASLTYGRNTGHGHVRPRPDGVKARCGGPGLCASCSAEAGAFDSLVPRDTGCNCAGAPATCDCLDALETRHPTLIAPPVSEKLCFAYCGDSCTCSAKRPASELVKVDRTLIAFTGLAGSGKTTAALHLVNAHGFTRLRFAGPLKAMMAALGLTPEQIDGAEKELPCDLLGGRTPRHAMQTIGTEWGRDLICADLWIRAWRAALERTLPGSAVVVDDCRFPNEVAAIKAAGGLIVEINRLGAGALSTAAGHSSEGQALPIDRTVSNAGTLDELHLSVDALARDITWAVANASRL